MRNAYRLAAIALLALTACSQAAGAVPTAPRATTAPTTNPAAPALVAPSAGLPASQTTAPAAASTPATVTQPSPTAATVANVATPAASAAAATAAPAPSTAPTAPAAPTPAPTAAPTTAPTGGGTAVAVSLVEMSIRLDKTSVSAGTVTFTVRNSGTVIHGFVVLKTSLPQNQIPTDPAQPAKVLEPGLVGRVASLAPGASATLTLNLSAGSYVFLCNEVAHYMAGMHTAFSVTP
jgi:uncharacterized cupredoxin-like copper-binding protein